MYVPVLEESISGILVILFTENQQKPISAETHMDSWLVKMGEHWYSNPEVSSSSP